MKKDECLRFVYRMPKSITNKKNRVLFEFFKSYNIYSALMQNPNSMLKKPISKLSKLKRPTPLRIAPLANRLNKPLENSDVVHDELIKKFQEIQQGLKVAMVTLKQQDAEAKEEKELMSPDDFLRKTQLKVFDPRAIHKTPTISEILAADSVADEALLECIKKISQISHGLRSKAFQEGIIF